MANGTDDLRCMNERYNYTVRGRKIIIVEWKSASTADPSGCEPEYQAPSSGEDALTGDNAGLTGVEKGLLLQLTAIPDLNEILSEKDEIPLNDILATAMIDYIKAQLVEDPKDQAKQLYYMQKFKERIARYNSRKVGGARTVAGTGYMR